MEETIHRSGTAWVSTERIHSGGRDIYLRHVEQVHVDHSRKDNTTPIASSILVLLVGLLVVDQQRGSGSTEAALLSTLCCFVFPVVMTIASLARMKSRVAVHVSGKPTVVFESYSRRDAEAFGAAIRRAVSGLG